MEGGKPSFRNTCVCYDGSTVWGKAHWWALCITFFGVVLIIGAIVYGFTYANGVEKAVVYSVLYGIHKLFPIKTRFN